MKKIHNGESIQMYKRSLLVVVCILTCFVMVYPVLNKEERSDTNAVSSISDSDRPIGFHELMTELEKQAAKFKGEAGILVKDLQTQQTIGINSSKLFPSASLVKVPIMAAYFQAQAEGKLNISDKLVLKRKHKIRSCSKLYFVRTGTKIPISDLIERMITESDNTATNVLVDNLGFSYLNQKFVEFGLKNTDIRRDIMDLEWRNAGIENYTTAEDMAVLLEKIYRGQLVSVDASAQMLAVLKRQKVNDRLPKGLPGNITIAHKTGLLKGTVSDVGVVFTTKGDFIICVITSDIRNFRTAKRFIGKIAACTYDKCYKNKTL